MKNLVTALVFLAYASPALAGPKSAEQVTRGIADAVERFANSIACERNKVKPEDVLVLNPGEYDVTLPKYAVLWNGDIGCWGGSGTGKTNLAIATINTGQFVVKPELSSPVVVFDSPVRYVTRVVSHSADTLILEGKEYGPDDPNANPTIPVQFILRLNEKGDWQLVTKTVLKR